MHQSKVTICIRATPQNKSEIYVFFPLCAMRFITFLLFYDNLEGN